MSLNSVGRNLEDTWARLFEIVKSLMNLRKIDRKLWNNGFNYVYFICTSNSNVFCWKLFDQIKNYLYQHVMDLYKDILSSDEDLLLAYYKKWSQFSTGNYYLHQFLYFLNKTVEKNPPRQSVWRERGYEVENYMVETGELGLDIWKRIIILPLKSKLVHLLLEGIQFERQGIGSNPTVFLGVIRSFVEVEEFRITDTLEFYQEIFETPYLEAMKEYFQQEASRLIQENSVSYYMEQASHLISREEFRSRKYLHASSYAKVGQICVQCMAVDQLDFLLGESKRMVQEENRKDLQHLYIFLVSQPNGQEILLQELQQHITNNGFEVINASKGDDTPQTFIESIMEVHNKFYSFIETVFLGDNNFFRALDKACITVVNHRANPKHMCRSPELLVRYCDSLLKKNAKACSENEVEDMMNKAITIFKYLNDKDVFQKFYSKMMTRRIIYDQSMSMEAEENMIKKLMQTGGHEFTSKIHRIFTDVGVSTDVNRCFMENLSNKDIKLEISFSVLVFQYGGWPLGQSTDSAFSMPQDLEKSFQQFDSFYRSKFNGRKLTWLHQFSEGELKLCYLKKSYYVRMSTYQVAILLLYERTEVLLFEEILELTKLNAEQLSKQILGLLESKLLLATDIEKPIESGSSFRLNMDYTNKKTKFRLAIVVQRDAVQQTQQETRESHESLDRKGAIQAAIVRIMKSRKVSKHSDLIQEVRNQVKDHFIPDMIMIKKCIENLIEREYIKRSVDFPDEYSYIA